LSPPARHIPPCESIRGYQTHEIRLRGFQKRTRPQPAKAGFACLAGAVSTAGKQKISEGEGLSPPPVPAYPSANQFAAMKSAKPAKAGFACLAGAVSTAGEQKSSMDRDCRPPPGISPCESIRGYQMREIRLRGFQKRTHPQPAKAGFACLAGAVSTAGAQKNSEG